MDFIKDTTIVSSNTSGIPLADLTEVMSEDVKKRFLITHFFNPPRYMRLLELVKGPNTSMMSIIIWLLLAKIFLVKGLYMQRYAKFCW
ncbi:MAG: hypothetical protein CM1200mP10_11490 [Candidatus Neomarinimicrobiota bacterium]|nr:MAG: hypothetical protein CM1200mP10_11490 [Candidatus Neomarinimicrobiota bacterium]